MTDSLSDRIAKTMRRAIAKSEFDLTPEDWVPCLADAVIAELRPQLDAWARLCVDGGDMTPAAQRMLGKMLEHGGGDD